MMADDVIHTDGPGKKDDVRINWGKVLGIGLIPIVLIFIGFFLVVKNIGTDSYQQVVNFVDERFGMVGIFLYVLIVDTLILPLSPDFVFPIVAGMPWYEVIPVVGLASALGGALSYFIGRLLIHVPIIDRWVGMAKDRWGRYIEKYGVLFVILSTLTPIPFSTVCMAAGAVKLSSRKVLPCCLFRILRMGIYFFLFKAGLVLV